TVPALAELNDTYGLADNRTVQEQTLPDWDKHHLGGYIVYDEYFSIIRVPELTPVQLLCQCVATTYAMLGDLPFTMLAREEIEVLFTAFHKMYGIFLPEAQPDIPPVPAAYIQHEHNNLAATDLLWTTLATDESQRKNIAMFRWLVGHHIFNTVTIFLTYALQEAIVALENDDEAQVITQLDRAATFLRAGIACEWYAANFSSDIYADIVRPSMVMQDVPGGDGFSGDQNAEFNRFKYMKEQLKRAMQKRQGTLSPQVQQALRQFVEMYVQDGEHHVLLASAMTGNSPSIAQEVWMEDLPDGTPVQSAVDFLRNMVLSRRAEFSQPAKKDTQPLLDPVAPMDIAKDTTGIIIGTVEDMAETQLLLREINGDDYLIGCTDGEYWAVSATCTHKEFPISDIPDDKGCMVCTKHGAVFEPKTGKNLRGPVGTTDLPRFDVINDNGVLKIQGIQKK
ncbi:MAG: Rieske (2Fe-2S) protein, partial [Aggregatilineales bacterium]